MVEGEDRAEHGEDEHESAHVREHAEADSAQAMARRRHCLVYRPRSTACEQGRRPRRGGVGCACETACDRRARRARARTRGRRVAWLLLRGRGRRDRAGERGSLDAFERARPGPPARLELSASGDADGPDRVDTDRAHDLVVQRRVFGLLPNRRYTYDFSAPFRKSRIVSAGEFRTAPAPSDPQTIRFAVSGDADGTMTPRPASLPTTFSRSMVGWPPSGITSTSTSATRSIRTARSVVCRRR